MVDPVTGAIIGSAVLNLVSKPLSDFLSTLIPVEDVTQRTAIRMIAQGRLHPDAIQELDFYKRLGDADKEVVLSYARQLYNDYAENELNGQRSVYLKELARVLKDLDAFDKAEFLGTLDDTLKRIRDIENELERLDRAEKDAWLKEELSFNAILTRIVEDRIKQAARAS